MCWAEVITSGAGTSDKGPTLRQLTHPTAANTFLFARTQIVRVTYNTAFTAAKRDIDHGAFPGHPHRQRPYGVDRFGRVKANATLTGTARVIMLDTKTPEDLRGAIIHPHRNAKRVFPQRIAQEFTSIGVEVENVGHAVEL